MLCSQHPQDERGRALWWRVSRTAIDPWSSHRQLPRLARFSAAAGHTLSLLP